MEMMRVKKMNNCRRRGYDDEHRSSYYMMLNSITNDLDILLSEFCQLSYPESGVPQVCQNKNRKQIGKKPMQIENCSAFGGSSTSGTLTSTDSNHSNKDVLSGTLTSTDSNNSVSKSLHTVSQSSCVDVVSVSLTRALEQPVYPDKQPSPSRSTSGSDLRQISVLERLTKTHPIWFLPTVPRSGAVHLLKDREIGIFIVRKSSRDEIFALSVQFPTQDGIPNVDHYLIEPTEHGHRLQGSNKFFDAIPNLIAHYCDNKEDLPYRLILPNAIQNAKTSQELTGLAMLGQDFWTSSKYEGQSRSSSRSNLSDHSSNMNKSVSEPISISKNPVTAYSQSDALLQNTPPKHSVIDFKSYLIKPNKDSLETKKCTRSVSVNESVHTKCSFQEARECIHGSFGHMTDPMTKCHSCLFEQERFKEVLHWELHQRTDSNLRRPDSQVSVPYAKPDKSPTKSNMCFQPSLDSLNIPEDYYFRSNLSDKLSDYEDIWKNNYSESNVGTVQADIVQRLQPNLVTFNNNNNVITNDRNSTDELLNQACTSSTKAEMRTLKEEHFSEQCTVKDFSVSVEQSHSSFSNVTTTTSSQVVSQQKQVHSVSENMTVVKENHVANGSITKVDGVHDNIIGQCKKVESANEIHWHLQPFSAEPRNSAVLKLTDQPGGQDTVDGPCHFVLGPLPGQGSDCDTDSCHSNSCASDEDGEADTEELDDGINITSVQTQTSPIWKLSPVQTGCVARKSVSTTMLTAMKSPVYSEPFDAISPEEQTVDKVPRLPKKMRRRSAPTFSSSRKRLGLNEQQRLSTLVASQTEDLSVSECSPDPKAEGEGLVQEEIVDDNDEVFQISPDNGEKCQTQPSHAEETYEKAWEAHSEEKLNKNMHKKLKEKPTPNPRKTKHTEKNEVVKSEDTFGRVTEVTDNRQVARVHPNQVLCIKKVHSEAHTVRDQIQILENFETEQSVSSPTMNKFPVFGRQVSEDAKIFYSEGSTAEDIIGSWNPELTLKPLKPFPVVLDTGAMSEYDNLNNPSYITPSVASVGTIFCNPWENSMVGKIMNTHSVRPEMSHNIAKSLPPTGAPPPLPPPMDTRERIKAWQESSQKYHSVSIEQEENRRCSMISDAGQSVDAVTFGGEISSSHDFKVSSNGQSPSDKTLVNGKSDSSAQRSKVAGHIPLYGADFREKMAPILANPRLLNKQDRNRNPDRKVRDYIIALSKDHSTTFGSTIENFIQCTLESQDNNPFNVTRNVRQFMNGIKNYLVKHGEGELEDLIERERNMLGKDEILNIDAIIEGALHVCVIQPLKQNIYRLFVNEYTRNGNLKLLSSNIKYARTKTPEEIGIRKGLTIPSGQTLELIKHYFTRMQKSYSPLKKLENLLGATSAIYRCVTSKQAGASTFGADDFLPMLIYILVQCGMVSVEIEADYMWGLLHPSLLTGEGGYYLTSLSSAVLVLKNFREMQETKASQHEGKLPSISDMQGFIKIAIPDEHRDTIVWKTLPVRPTMTTKDVCSLIAHKFKITNPQDYGLYTLDNGEECKLMDMECPQGLKRERMSHNKECIFAYKRNAANIAWPKSVQ